jgi:hypothetical protein
MAEQENGQAEVMPDDGTVELNLFKPDGTLKATIRLPAANVSKGVKVLSMPDGAVYNRVSDTNWQQEAPADAE